MFEVYALYNTFKSYIQMLCFKIIKNDSLKKVLIFWIVTRHILSNRLKQSKIIN